MSIPLVILAIILFVGLVVIHEFGHFIAARRNGVEVEEFGIGFPPRAWLKRVKSSKGDYDFTLNWLPLGGFVKLKGEHDADTEPGTFGAAPLWAKVKIMLAGVVMNALTALVLLTVLAWIGLPQILENQFTVESDTKITRQQVLIGFIEDDSPAERAGLQTHDEIQAFVTEEGDRYEIKSAEELPVATEQLAGQTVEIEYVRNDVEQVTEATIRTQEEIAESVPEGPEQKGYLGVAPQEFTVQRSTWSAPIVAAGLMKQMTEATLKGIGTAFSALFRGDTATASNQVAGVVGIGYLLTQGSALGFQFILLIIAVISLTLAIMNALPIPALDGGRLFVTLLFRGLRKPLTPKLEEWIHGTGFALLMILFVLITIVDVRRIF